MKKYYLVLLSIILNSTLSFADSDLNSKAINDTDKLLQSNTISDLNKFDWSHITKEEARETLGKHIDAAKVPHGDIVIPSDVVHSRRYIVSQWQRAAAGAVVIVFSKDSEGDLVLALGAQRGKLTSPQGYMEIPLPKEDLTGIREKGGSRLNGSTGEIVKADASLEDNAVREVKEELNLDINKNKLVLIGVSLQNEGGVVPVIAAQYTVMLDQASPLKVIDEEFMDDDLQSPKWFKVKDIVCKASNCYVDGEAIAIDKRHIPMIQKALKHFGNELQLDQYKNFIDFRPSIQKN